MRSGSGSRPIWVCPVSHKPRASWPFVPTRSCPTQSWRFPTRSWTPDLPTTRWCGGPQASAFMQARHCGSATDPKPEHCVSLIANPGNSLLCSARCWRTWQAWRCARSSGAGMPGRLWKARRACGPSVTVLRWASMQLTSMVVSSTPIHNGRRFTAFRWSKARVPAGPLPCTRKTVVRCLPNGNGPRASGSTSIWSFAFCNQVVRCAM